MLVGDKEPPTGPWHEQSVTLADLRRTATPPKQLRCDGSASAKGENGAEEQSWVLCGAGWEDADLVRLKELETQESEDHERYIAEEDL